MTEKLLFMNLTHSLWVMDVDDGRLLRQATDEDKAALPIMEETEFWESADKLFTRIMESTRKSNE